MIKRIMVLFTIVVLSGLVAKATAITISPVDAKGIRFTEAQYFVVSYLNVKTSPMLEDRTLLEFDVSGLSGAIPLATLDVGLGNADPGPPDGIIDLFTYVGDGIITAADFYAGGPTPFTSFIGVDGDLSIDVTSAIETAMAGGEQFIGFRLSTETDDRYLMGHSIGMADPVLTVVPEPATVLLLGLGAMVVLRKPRS